MAQARFGADGRAADGAPLPASAFNDYYKWTMLPAISPAYSQFSRKFDLGK